MSQKAVEEFFHSVEHDTAVRQQLAASANEDAFLAAAVRLGAERGYVFTAEEARAAAVASKANGELSEAALAGVSGGAFDAFLFFNPK